MAASKLLSFFPLLFPLLSHPIPWQLLLLLANTDPPALRHLSAQLLIPLRIVCPKLWSRCFGPPLLWRPSPPSDLTLPALQIPLAPNRDVSASYLP
ncbi:hypothetical protein PPACK8108_LOCUS12171 [Phakopsora pachyrhizi]|uniref:Secreted protein n=1 Tax=Phakopsora pachyrhizi TaxID=170000 RepID=A0AAV0B3H1_PHAPC|nr:hypothetical protein PPACK8108_LOCUS12171 [Phakopsora pachyrhizi]